MRLCGGRERAVHGEWDEVTSHRGCTLVLEASRAFPVTCSLGSRNKPVPVWSQHEAGPASMGDDVPILSSTENVAETKTIPFSLGIFMYL